MIKHCLVLQVGEKADMYKLKSILFTYFVLAFINRYWLQTRPDIHSLRGLHDLPVHEQAIGRCGWIPLHVRLLREGGKDCGAGDGSKKDNGERDGGGGDDGGGDGDWE